MKEGLPVRALGSLEPLTKEALVIGLHAGWI